MNYKCQNCGATLDIPEDNFDNSEIKCPYCQSVASYETLLAYYKLLYEKQVVKQDIEENELDKELKRELLNELKLQKQKREKEEIKRQKEEDNRIDKILLPVCINFVRIVVVGFIIGYIIFVIWVFSL